MTKSLLISQSSSRMVNVLNELAKYLVVKRVNKDVLEKLERGETVEAYLYCTKGKPYLINKDMLSEYYELRNVYTQNFTYEILNGTIPVKVVIDGYKRIYHDDYIGRTKEVLKHACISVDEYNDYGNGKDLYALHISNVEIFDEVMGLDDFVMWDEKRWYTDDNAWATHWKPVTRPPQNMMTVWVK